MVVHYIAGICAEHLKFSNDKISILIALCFTVCLSHGYLPTASFETTIVPIVKNKSGNLMDDLSTALNSSDIGGYLGPAFLNHLCYADDLIFQ